MTVTLTPAPLSGSVAAPVSKSAAHRLLICAALADRPSTLSICATSRDIEATIDCLRALGADVTRSGGRIIVTPTAQNAQNPRLHCGESASTLRFLLPVAAAMSQGAIFEGGGRLPDRPIEPLIDAMERGGVGFSARRLPLELSGRLQSGAFELTGSLSSQFVSGLLLALPLLEGDSEIILISPLQSAGYVEMTLAALGAFGVETEKTPNGYAVRGCQKYVSPGELEVEGDWSNAAFMLCAGALGGGVKVTGLDIYSPQPDRKILDVLRAMGAGVSVDKEGITVVGGALRGIDLDVSGTPDLLPVLSLTATFAEGVSRFTGAERLRLKESDRLAACASMINALGSRAEETPEGLIVYGGGLVGGSVEGFGDHRMVMSAAVAALRCRKAVTISGAEAVKKSYPAFFEDLTALGANIGQS